MKAFAAALLCSLVLGCATPPAPTPSPTQPLIASSTPTTEPPSPTLLTESAGNVIFTRPANWYEQRPTVNLDPGTELWLSSVPLASANGPMPLGFPTTYLSGGVLPDGGVLITFGSGAVLALPRPTPLTFDNVRDDACAAVGGHALASSMQGTYIAACLNGSAADLAFDAFLGSLRLGL